MNFELKPIWFVLFCDGVIWILGLGYYDRKWMIFIKIDFSSNVVHTLFLLRCRWCNWFWVNKLNENRVNAYQPIPVATLLILLLSLARPHFVLDLMNGNWEKSWKTDIEIYWCRCQNNEWKYEIYVFCFRLPIVFQIVDIR